MRLTQGGDRYDCPDCTGDLWLGSRGVFIGFVYE